MSDPAIAIAVLFERLGHMLEKIESMNTKLDAQDKKRTEALEELEQRVEHVESQLNSAKYFLAGIACAGGALGGGIAAGLARLLGG